MFDRFGEFDSAEELNMAAEGQKQEGDEVSFYALAKENGIDREDAADYWNGDTPQLTTTSMAAFGRLQVLEQKEINTKKSQIEKMPLQVILTMLKGMCTEESMARAVMKKGKRLTDILNAMKNEAKKNKSGGVGIACGTDRQLCEIIKAYYMEPEKEFQEKISSLYS